MNGISKDYGAVSSVEELLEQEEKGKTKREKNLELLIQGSPFLLGVLALLEYFYVPNHQGFEASYVYAFFLLLLLVGNGISFLLSFRGKRQRKNYLYHAPFRALVFFLFTLYDLLTLKSNILITPYFPSIDKVLSSMVQDRAYLWECTMSSLFLLFCGYFSGLIVGLLTGIACGYNKKLLDRTFYEAAGLHSQYHMASHCHGFGNFFVPGKRLYHCAGRMVFYYPGNDYRYSEHGQVLL